MEHCSKPLVAQSEALAEEANQAGRLSSTEGELYCECGERVSACRKPWMDGPTGGRWWPTRHYPKMPPPRRLKTLRGKRNYTK